MRPGDGSGAACTSPATSRDAVWIAIADTAIGINTEDLGELFREFSQLDSSASWREQGTGLGLAPSRRFVELHGGVIGVESIMGAGSTFWFILPTKGPVGRSQLRTGSV
jgi:signal transduction histidine kinase